MQCRAALVGAALATASFALTTETSSAATQWLPTFFELASPGSGIQPAWEAEKSEWQAVVAPNPDTVARNEYSDPGYSAPDTVSSVAAPVSSSWTNMLLVFANFRTAR